MTIQLDPEGNEIAALLDLAGDLTGKNVLEIGSGDGRLTWRYAEQAGHVVEPDKQAKLASVAHHLGWPLSIHGIGDKAIDVCLDALEAAQKSNPRKHARHRLEHCTMALPRMFDRIKRLGVTPVLQPGFIWELGDNWFRQLGKGTCARLKPFRTLLDNKILMAFSSDRPVVSGAPLLGIHSAVNQKTRTGQDYAPQEKITPEEALRCYTINGAYATFEENHQWP